MLPRYDNMYANLCFRWTYPLRIYCLSPRTTFPQSQQTATDVAELQWRFSTLPLTYVNSYGPPKIASVGRRNGSSLAVASSYGVCILDIRKYKWKQFGTTTEERSFGIVAMTWWEGSNGSGCGEDSASFSEEETEDLLVAIIRSGNGCQYLSCWSPKRYVKTALPKIHESTLTRCFFCRLDVAHQLLEASDAKPGLTDETILEPSWGIPLPKDVEATSISLLAEPTAARSNYVQKPRRAVVFVSSTNMDTSEMDYATFQLQVAANTKKIDNNSTFSESYLERKPYVVRVKASVHGTLKNGARSGGPISSVLLAGASFRFDLDPSDGKKTKSLQGAFPTFLASNLSQLPI
jgi:hypothetical protein